MDDVAYRLAVSELDVDEAVQGFLAAQLWSQSDELMVGADNDLPDVIPGVDRSEHGEMMDWFYDTDDIDSAYVARVRGEIVDFAARHPLAVRMYVNSPGSQVSELGGSGSFGHNFLLTRGGHGVGFWDRGLGELGDYLTEVAESYGDSEYLSDGALCSDPKTGDTSRFVAGNLYA